MEKDSLLKIYLKVSVKTTKNDIYLPLRFFKNSANSTAMYPKYFQKSKKSTMKEKFSVAAFTNVCIIKHRSKLSE